LVHVHERTDASGRPLQIVHRDLSPQNVMVSYSGDTKLIDFGTARGQNRKCHTVSGIVFAKPGYVAPEVANNTPGGIPADLYAFGIMLWELLAGRRFLSGEAAAHLALVAVGKRNPAPLAQLTGAPGELDRVIAKLTAPRTEHRYLAAKDALADLLAVLKKAPSMADGDRSVRGRIAQLMGRLYPAEPARSRAEFARLVSDAREIEVKPSSLPAPSPEPAPVVEAAPSDLLPGTRFRLIREIGHGGMGTVYEACHIDLGRTVALKVLRKEHSMDAQRMKQFRAEARVVADLVHENLVKVHEFGVAEDGRAYYAMDLLEGQSLAQYLEQHKGMDWREAAEVGIQACRALEVAHAAGVTHCDIKPANLFLTQDNVVKLLDFGIAKGVTSSPERVEKGQSEAIRIVGTPEYLAPEQARGIEPDERADVYSLGCVLYELVTGRLPHHANNTIELLDLKSNTLPDSPRQRAPQRGLPQMLDKAIMNSLKIDPADRFATAEELREALESALREPERRRQRRRRMGFLTLGALAALCGVGAGMVTVDPALRTRVAERAGDLAGQLQALRKPPSTAELARAANEPVDAKRRAATKPAAKATAAAPLAPAVDAADAVGEASGEEASAESPLDDAETVAVAAAEEATESAAAEIDEAASDATLQDAKPVPPAEADTQDTLLQALVQAEQQMTEGNRIKGF
jgi:serine/threonine-protein kinase